MTPGKTSGAARHQHYVPQFLLREFTVAGTEQVFAFDKRDGRSFRTSVRNVGGQRDYYDVPRAFLERLLTEDAARRAETGDTGDDAGTRRWQPGDPVPTLTFEPALGEIESRAGAAIDRVLRAASLTGLTEEDRGAIALFAAVQCIRGPDLRAQHEQVGTLLRDQVRAWAKAEGVDPECIGRDGEPTGR